MAPRASPLGGPFPFGEICMEIDTDNVEHVIERPPHGIDDANRLELVAALLEIRGIEYDADDLEGSDRIPRTTLLDLIFEAVEDNADEAK